MFRIEELEKLVAKHDEWIAELVSKQAFAEMLEQVQKETAETEKNPNLEERIVASLKEQGEVETVDSERVKSLAEQIRMDLDKKADAARKRLKERGGNLF